MLRLPVPVAVSLVAGLATAWHAIHSTSVCFSAVLAASAFACIEFTWYATTTEQPNGDLAFTPFQPTCRAGHTTWAQFWANVLYTPVLLFTFRQVVSSAFVRVVLFPCNIWLLEIVEGYALMLLFGRNIAWTYTTNDAYCHGNIRLGFWKQWLALGIVLECVGYRVLDTLGEWCAASCVPLEGVLLAFGVATIKYGH
ncbi:hypothetical protein H310_07869 [Aphanomyces invadans]|uniref:Uncharacterized protein n=1 Tax=Aphanomyces invadans TaxID=157072 RepID=A0A024U2I4_9STRA|nr:hypothetical protein H310_07869 [Aphanomyces invadans]ETV99827.1 hypothetical protein H310_07869 [Aphanomyces invadans]|eukprot:XP_008871603.1 hypothetical protein H310_07869 [Aphanomyces invadans]